MVTRKRPPNRKRPDRLVAPDAAKVKNAIAADHAVAPVERARKAMDQKWGTDRLVELMSVEHAAAFGGLCEKLEQAMMADPVDIDYVTAVAANVAALYGRMDEIATQAGHSPVVDPTLIWHCVINDKPTPALGVTPSGCLHG